MSVLVTRNFATSFVPSRRHLAVVERHLDEHRRVAHRLDVVVGRVLHQVAGGQRSPSVTPASARSSARTSARRGRRRTLRAPSCGPRPPPVRCSAGSVRSAIGARGHAVEIGLVVEKTGDAVLDDFWQPADVRRHDRHLARHGLERREPEALLRGWQQEDVGGREQRNHILLRAEHLDERCDVELPAEPVRRPELGPVADEQQSGGDRTADPGKDLHHRIDPLDRPEVGHVDDELRRRVRRETLSQAREPHAAGRRRNRDSSE